ncbi:MAG: hypothetical protein ACREF4_10565 [Gammaproteobacteria bacterium]
MAFAPYADLAEFRDWIVLPDAIDDAVIVGVVASVTEWIDEYCDRHFWRDGVGGSEVARTFVPCHSYRLDIDDLVPGSVTDFKTDESGDGTFETIWSVSDYQLLPVNRPTGRPFTSVEAVGGRLFPIRYDRMRSDRVEITGIWGWSAVPNAVHQACLIQSARILKARYSPEGQAGVDAFGGVVRVPGQVDPRAIDLLNPYRRTAVLVA